MPWWQFRLRAEAADCEAAEAALFAAGALSVTLLDGADQPILEPPPGQTPLWAQLVLVGLFDGERRPAELAQALSSALARPVEAAQLERLDDRDWVRAWQAEASALHFGGRLWVVPSHCPPPAAPDAIALRLDPGLAFGTGTHPTTALCLRWLALNEPRGARVLDIGCGSGILAIAALLLGAEAATGTDIDPQALAASAANAAANAVAERLTLCPSSAPSDGGFELVLANILYRPLCELRDEIATAARPGAPVVLSGILREQGPPLARHYAAVLDDIELQQQGDWALLSGRRHL